jgi:hypothetical protein
MNFEKFIARDHKLRDDYLKGSNIKGVSKVIFNIRSWLQRHFGIWDIWDILPYGYRFFYWDNVKPLFKPQHTRLRKVIPRRWCDLTEIIKIVNFEIIKSFYEDEYKAGIVDWQADEYHAEFAKWLEEAYTYITIERSQLEEQKNNAYPDVNLDSMFHEPETDEHGNVTRRIKTCEERYGKSYEETYREVNRLEALIDKKDTVILTGLIKKRDYFWT